MHDPWVRESRLERGEQYQPHTYEARPPRKRTLLNGKLVYGDGMTAPTAYTLDCTIRDISEGGARIVLDKTQFLPSNVYLIVIKYCVAYRARLVWLDYPARGLHFLETHSMNAALPDELKFLRKLWGDLYTRTGNTLASG
jgi:hypothetical protein